MAAAATARRATGFTGRGWGWIFRFVGGFGVVVVWEGLESLPRRRLLVGVVTYRDADRQF